MTLIDRYIATIGERLPPRGRDDIESELRSLLMDEIEETYGENPSDADVKAALKKFGSPTEVARRYKGRRPVIADGYAPFYFFVLKVTLGAVALAFAVIAALALIRGPREASDVARIIGSFFTSLGSAWLSATGAITLIGIVATRCKPDAAIDIDESWDPEELKAVEEEEAKPGKIESIVGIAGNILMLTLMNAYPAVVTAAENAFFGSTNFADYGHRVDISILREYIPAFSAIWLADIALNAAGLAFPHLRKRLAAFGVATDVLTAIVMAVMVLDTRLFIAYRGIVGFRLVFIIVAAAEAISILVLLGQEIAKRVRYLLD